MNDTISRQDAIELIHSLYPSAPIMRMNKERWEKKYKPYIEAEKALEMLPSAEPERLTDDDFETIRIHLNAQKEKLCNQKRWEEAEEYQRIIDRLMAFASAESERHLTCKNCIHLGHAYMMPCKNCKRNQMLPDWYEERREE